MSHSKLAACCHTLLLHPGRCSSRDWVTETKTQRGAVTCYLLAGLLTLGSGRGRRRDEGNMQMKVSHCVRQKGMATLQLAFP